MLFCWFTLSHSSISQFCFPINVYKFINFFRRARWMNEWSWRWGARALPTIVIETEQELQVWFTISYFCISSRRSTMIVMLRYYPRVVVVEWNGEDGEEEEVKKPNLLWMKPCSSLFSSHSLIHSSAGHKRWQHKRRKWHDLATTAPGRRWMEYTSVIHRAGVKQHECCGITTISMGLLPSRSAPMISANPIEHRAMFFSRCSLGVACLEHYLQVSGLIFPDTYTRKHCQLIGISVRLASTSTAAP